MPNSKFKEQEKRDLSKLANGEQNSFALSFIEFRYVLKSICADSCADSFSLNEAMDNPGKVDFGSSYCAYYFDRSANRLKIGFGKEGDLSSPLDFALVPALKNENSSAPSVIWQRPYDKSRHFDVEKLAQTCFLILTQKL